MTMSGNVDFETENDRDDFIEYYNKYMQKQFPGSGNFVSRPYIEKGDVPDYDSYKLMRSIISPPAYGTREKKSKYDILKENLRIRPNSSRRAVYPLKSRCSRKKMGICPEIRFLKGETVPVLIEYEIESSTHGGYCSDADCEYSVEKKLYRVDIDPSILTDLQSYEQYIPVDMNEEGSGYCGITEDCVLHGLEKHDYRIMILNVQYL